MQVRPVAAAAAAAAAATAAARRIRMKNPNASIFVIHSETKKNNKRVG